MGGVYSPFFPLGTQSSNDPIHSIGRIDLAVMEPEASVGTGRRAVLTSKLGGFFPLAVKKSLEDSPSAATNIANLSSVPVCSSLYLFLCFLSISVSLFQNALSATSFFFFLICYFNQLRTTSG